MSQNIQKIFENLQEYEPSRELQGRILRVIAVKRMRSIRRNLMLVRVGFVASLGALAYTLAVFGKAFLNSDFWNLVKLAFSDTGVVGSHFGDFSLSLLETLPVMEIFLILLPVFAVLMIASFYFKINDNNFKHA
jgi:hypothetical protein